MNQEENEVSINLADMFAHLLHNWKFILIMMAVFMVLVGGVMSFRDYIGMENKYTDETYQSMIRELTDVQISNINQFYNRYKNYKERISDNEFYMDNSLMMKIDPYHVSVYTVEYLVKTGYQGIMGTFESAALDLDDYQEMAKIMGDDIDARYVNELVGLWGSIQQDSYDIDTDKVGDVINGNITNTYTGILTFRVTINDRPTCEKIAEVADRAIMEHLEKLKAAGIKAEISPLTTAYTEKVDTSIAEYQRGQIDSGSGLVTSYFKFVEDAEDSLGEDEAEVFKYLVEKEEETTDKIHWKRWIVVGAAVGIVIAVAILVVGYLLIPGVKTNEDAFLLTKDKEMGIVIQKATSKVFLGKLFHNWAKNVEFHGIRQLPDTESIPLVCDRILRLCESKKAKNVFLVSDSDDKYSKDVLDNCLKILNEKGLLAKSGNPGASLESLENLRASAAAVLVLTKKSSLPDSVKGNIAVCEENEIPIVGNFIIHPQR